MSDFDEILKRLEILETQVAALADAQNEGRRAADLFAMVDRDVADLNTAFGTQRKLMQALRDEQVGQGRSLTEYGQALDGIIEPVDGRYSIVRYSVSRALNVTRQSLLGTADPGTI